jgi:hypothetical protein
VLLVGLPVAVEGGEQSKLVLVLGFGLLEGGTAPVLLDERRNESSG